MGRGIDSRNRVWNWVAKLHRLASRYDNPMPTWFLAPIAGLKLPTLQCSLPTPVSHPSTWRTKYLHIQGIEYRAVSGVFRTMAPPPPLHPASVSSPRSKGGGGLLTVLLIIYSMPSHLTEAWKVGFPLLVVSYHRISAG
jgi:hypothetical protein